MCADQMVQTNPRRLPTYNGDHGMAQLITSHTMEARVQSQRSPYGVCS